VFTLRKQSGLMRFQMEVIESGQAQDIFDPLYNYLALSSGNRIDENAS